MMVRRMVLASAGGLALALGAGLAVAQDKGQVEVQVDHHHAARSRRQVSAVTVRPDTPLKARY